MKILKKIGILSAFLICLQAGLVQAVADNAMFVQSAMQKYPELVDGFNILRVAGHDTSTFQEFMTQELIAISKAQSLVCAGMKDRFVEILKHGIIQENESVLQNQEPIFQYVIKYSIGMRNPGAQTPDAQAVSDPDFMKPIVKEWVNEKDEQDQTLLYYAVKHNLVNMIQKLIEFGADVNIRDAKGLTLLHEIARYVPSDESAPSIDSVRLEIVKILVAAGADINASMPGSYYTPLHYAAMTGKKSLVTLLLDLGASMTILNCDGRTAEDLSMNRGMRIIFEQTKLNRIGAGASLLSLPSYYLYR